MKFTQVSVLLATAAAPQASALKIFRNRKADDTAADAQQQRQLADRWYAVRSPAGYDYGWCNSPVPGGYTETTYATDLACCKGAFPDQQSGYCLQWLQSAPTAAPTPTGGPDAWYRDNNVDATMGVCINTAPTPKDSSVTIYDTQAECCIKEYGFQADGYCLSQMVTPPTAAPTTLADKKWFKDPESNDFTTGTCINDGPVPSGYVAYGTNAECCAGEYSTQITGACFAGMANAPSAAPSSVDDIKWFPDWSKAWTDGVCISGAAPPSGYTFASQAECCLNAYAGQTSGACLADMDSPPTAAPFTVADLVFYPIYTGDWSTGYCDNDPDKAPTVGSLGVSIFTTQAECCDLYFPNQPGRFCKTRVPFEGSLAPTPAPIYFYPKWGSSVDEGRCLNDGMEPAGITLYLDGKKCCESEFPKSDGTPGIGGCLLALGYTNAPTATPTPKPTHKPVA
mmetsp:Transcript_26094/g.53986  ORF Transcript_26094/g.53986 Transcript_26094/m.53986 type:complete len:453 (+) Transcript_26094:183-1541(+)